MKTSRRVFLTGGAAALLTVACSSPFQSSSSEKVVNLYSARHYDADTQVYEGFTKKTGIRVNLIEAPADKLIERIKSEGTNSPADVMITVDAGNLWRAKQAGVLQAIDSTTLNAQIPQNLRDPEGMWYGLTKRARVIMYNKARVKPTEITTYEDLADPKWKGKVLVRSSNNVYNQSLVGSILAADGPDQTEAWARGVVANFARPPEGNDISQIKALAAGTGEVALANTYYLARLAKSSQPEDQVVADKVGIIFPNQSGAGSLGRGTHVNISGGGVAKYAPHREAAIQFLEYLVSPEAQAIFAANNNEYPVVAGVKLDPVLASYSTSFKEDSLNAEVYGKNNEQALKIMDRAGWK